VLLLFSAEIDNGAERETVPNDLMQRPAIERGVVALCHCPVFYQQQGFPPLCSFFVQLQKKNVRGIGVSGLLVVILKITFERSFKHTTGLPGTGHGRR
jgi:hypothetical protein